MYTINEVSKLVGVPEHTIRYWEKALGDIIRPKRTEGGHRRYDDDAVRMLERVRDLTERLGLNLRMVAWTLEQEEAARLHTSGSQAVLDEKQKDFLVREIVRILEEQVASWFADAEKGHKPGFRELCLANQSSSEPKEIG